MEMQAGRSADALETFYGPMSASFTLLPRRTTLILENQNPVTTVGGYVSRSPLRSVWHTPLGQNTIGTNNYLTSLAAHEGRHLIQFAAMDRGFNRVFGFLMGDQGRDAAMGWSLPAWWLEGDATVAESAFTHGGQARLATSYMLTRTNVLAGRHFSYMKAIHGSYSTPVPDRYEMGSYMVSRVNRSSGPDAWNRIIDRWARQSWNPFAFSAAMKKETGRGAAETYADMIRQTYELWGARAEDIGYTEIRRMNHTARRVWTSYFFPVYDSDGTILAQKVGFDDSGVTLVRLYPGGREDKLFEYAPRYSSRVSVENGQIVWAEYVPDPRWVRGYNEIVIRDVAHGQVRRLTHHSKLEAPVLSPDGSRVAAIEDTPEDVISLAIIDARTGEIRRIAAPDQNFLSSPAWAPDGHRIVLVRQTVTGEKGLSVVDTETGKFTDVISPSPGDVTYPVFWGDYVLYSSPLNGIDNIYSVHTVTGERRQVTSSRYGAGYASVSRDGHRLVYSDYTPDGYDVAEIELDPASWRPVSEVEQAGIGYHETNAHDYTAGIRAGSYRSERYHPLSHLFDVHSWGAISPPPQVEFGFRSTDKMQLLDFSAGMTYDTNERTAGYGLSGSYGAMYPVLDFGYSDRRRETRYPDHTSRWTERTTRAGFRIPLDLSRGIYSSSLTFSSGIESRRLTGGGLMPMNYSVSYNRFREFAARDVAPRWGQSLFVGYQHTPWSGEYTGNLMTATAGLLLPSPVRHHSIQLAGGNERRNGGNYAFSSQMIFPRGYDSVVAGSLWLASANYGLPLAFPDAALGQIAFVNRITGNLFFDYGRADGRLYRSTGMEVVFDLHPLSMLSAFRIGIRYAYRLDGGGSRVEPFLALNW